MSKKNRNELAYKMAEKWNKNADKMHDRVERITKDKDAYPEGALVASRIQSAEQAKNTKKAIRGERRE